MKRLKKLTAGFALAIALLAIAPSGVNAEWKKDNNGWWYSQGSSYATNWAKINGQWYYFDSNGYMKTGWISDNGSWYYLNTDGTMAHDTTINGLYVNSDGTINQTTGFSCH